MYLEVFEVLWKKRHVYSAPVAVKVRIAVFGAVRLGDFTHSNSACSETIPFVTPCPPVSPANPSRSSLCTLKPQSGAVAVDPDRGRKANVGYPRAVSAARTRRREAPAGASGEALRRRGPGAPPAAGGRLVGAAHWIVATAVAADRQVNTRPRLAWMRETQALLWPFEINPFCLQFCSRPFTCLSGCAGKRK